MRILKRTMACIMVLAISINMTVPFVSAEENSKSTKQQVESESNRGPVYETDQLKVTFTVDGQWDNGYNASVKIENTGEEVIHDWYLDFSYEEVISNIWNAEIVSYRSGNYVIKNAGWNQDIKAGDSVSFGFQASERFCGYPEKYGICNGKVLATEKNYTVKYRLDSDWGSGFTGTVSITNNAKTVLEDWTIEFDFDRTISSVWNAEIESHENNHYSMSNSGYNSNIKAGETVSFGFLGTGGNRTEEPENYVLYSYQLSSDCFLYFDGCDESVRNVPTAQSVKSGTYAEKPEKPVRDGYSFMGWYLDKEYTKYFDFDTRKITSDTTLYARWLNLLSEEDSDGDGICDSLEEYIGTDPLKSDTDGDGVSDYTEIMKLDTDPTLFDTDGNGVSDGEEDVDGDGLSNQLEEKYNTNTTLKDTDEDGLNDFEEVNQYKTDPNQEDTDGDTLTDGDEITLGLNPLKKDTDEDGVLDCDEIIEQELKTKISNSEKKVIKSVGVNLSCSGLIDNHLEIENVYDKDMLSSNVVGLVGVPVSIESDVDFDEAVITFTYEDTKETDLCMMWYDEANDTYVLLEDSVVDTEKNTVSYTTTHFSTYLVVDKDRWMKTLEKNAIDNLDIMNWIKNNLFGKGDGSVYKCYETGMTWNEAKEYCEQKGGHLVTITSADEQAIVESLIRSEGSKNNYWIGADRFMNSSSYEWVTGEEMSYTNYKGGYADNYGNQEDALMIYRNENPKLSGSCFGYWNDINRNGTCLGESFFGLENMGFICEWDNVKVTDSDNDGVMDILEEGYMLSNGQIITSDPTKADTDGDGLSDGEEMGEPDIATVTTREKEYVILVWHAKSDPNKKDSDGDGLYDNQARKANGKIVAPIDPEPLKANGPDGIWDTHVMQQEIGVVSEYYKINNSSTEITTMIETLSSAIQKTGKEANVAIPNNEEVATAVVQGILMVRDNVKASRDIIRTIALAIKLFCNGEAATVAGAYFLNFVYDENEIAYHSKSDTWQRYFGYNEFYDEIFDIGSYMDYLSIYFSTESEEYRLWMWKGDYWNLHSGAEIGLYSYSDEYSGTPQYNAIDFEVPMTLSLYNYYKRDNIDNIFSWSPIENQWWITGFSGQNDKFMTPDPKAMISIGSLDLSRWKEMYEALKDADGKQFELVANEKYRNYLLFDDANKTVWVMWYEGVDVNV